MNVGSAAWRILTGGIFAPLTDSANRSLATSLRTDDSVWPQVTWLADVNYVTPALWDSFRKRGLAHLLPREAAQYLQAIYELNSARNQAMQAELEEVLVALNSAEIVPCLLKGAFYLREGIYRDPALRILSDLDLLIPGMLMLKAQKTLSSLGYDPMDGLSWDFSSHHHVPPLARAGGCASIELHEEPLYLDGQRYLRAKEVWERVMRIDRNGVRYAVIDPTSAVLVSILHSEVADRNLQRFVISLRSLQDLSALALAYGDRIDWQAVGRRLRVGGHDRVFRDFFYLADRLAGLRPLSFKFGVLPRIRYLSCRLVLRHASLRPWLRRAERVSVRAIRARHGDQAGRFERLPQPRAE